MELQLPKIRERLMITKQEQAAQLGVSRQMLWAYERGKSKPGIMVLRRICLMAGRALVKLDVGLFF